MNIYIQMEIKVRELEGRLLLALAAAERGHRVLLGDVRPYLTIAPQVFPAGVFHDKSLTPSRRKLELFRSLNSIGVALTSQDEEHWLALPSFDVPGRKRFSTESLGLAARSFSWGQHETDSLQHLYPGEPAARIVTTGSPRVDLWRPSLADYHRSTAVTPDRDYLLFSSNFSAALDVNPFWVKIRDKRQHYEGLEDPFEFDRYGFSADKFRVLGEFVRAIRRAAQRHPDVLVVVRPHPIEAQGAWTDLIGPVPNVLVTREGTLAAWAHRAKAVIQNGCTSGYEAAVSGTPVISFHPEDIFADHPVNELGRRAHDQLELAALIDEVIARPVGDEGWLSDSGRALLERRIASLDGRLATDRIVDEWELLAPEGSAPWSRRRILAIRRRLRARTILGQRARRVIPRRESPGAAGPSEPSERSDIRFRSAHKFPPLTRDEVASITMGLSATLGRFHGVRAQVIAPDLVAVLPPRGRPSARSTSHTP
jgi:surface carbohydrate biosynthesis protein